MKIGFKMINKDIKVSKTPLAQAPLFKQAHLVFINLSASILITPSLASLTNSELQNKNEASASGKKNIECGK